MPWLYACALAGPLKLRIRLAPEGPPSRRYRVTLFFCELRDTAGAGCFDVNLQGGTVLSGLDVGQEARGPKRPLIKETSVDAADQLTLELAPRTGEPPIISAIEIEELPAR